MWVGCASKRYSTHACNVSVQYYVLILLLPSKRNAWLLVSINLVLCLFLPSPLQPRVQVIVSHLVIICCFPLDFFTQWDCPQVSLDGGTLFGVCAHERLTYAPKACAGTQSRLILTATSGLIASHSIMTRTGVYFTYK